MNYLNSPDVRRHFVKARVVDFNRDTSIKPHEIGTIIEGLIGKKMIAAGKGKNPQYRLTVFGDQELKRRAMPGAELI